MAIILVDFDNTITSYESYPEIAPIRDNAKDVINKYYDLGHCIIINTCRCDDAQIMAQKWLDNQGVKYCHINENCKCRVKFYGNDTRKIGGHIYIDDKNIDCVLGEINWKRIDAQLDKIFSVCDFIRVEDMSGCIRK